MGNTFDRILQAGVVALLCAAGFAAAAGECRLDSPAHRLTVMELYTSEGCSSCPPADRWFSALRDQGIADASVVLLAFHVDYWNQLGWPDRFSRAQYSGRQREVARRGSSRVIYTPQFTLDGQDFRPAYDLGRLRNRLEAINREPARATIRSTIRATAAELYIAGAVEVPDRTLARNAQIWIALFENGLSTSVGAGENKGAKLHHDFVVRELAGPLRTDATGIAYLRQQLKLPADGLPARMGVAILTEHVVTGEILQAAARYPLCAP